MSTKLNSWSDLDYDPQIDFENGDVVEFDGPDGDERVTAVIVRVYNARDDYHAANGVDRYSINRNSDNIKLISRKYEAE